MKIVDHTPFLNANGEISLLNRLKTAFQFGSSWYPEIQAQKVVMDNLSRALDRTYTLLRNVLLPGLGVKIPMILVGPPGVYLLYVTHLRGMYRAKGDSWGIVEGSSFRPARINLLTRASRLARALQVYLQRQGYEGLPHVEGVLLAADPGLHVDSVRPIVRVVLRDALERFAVSITQARVILSQEAVLEITNRILHPRPVQPQPPEPVSVAEAEPAPAEPARPAFETAESQPWSAKGLGFEFREEAQPESAAETPVEPAPLPAWSHPPSQTRPASRPRRARFTCKQWAVLAVFAMIEIVILIVFFYLFLTSR